MIIRKIWRVYLNLSDCAANVSFPIDTSTHQTRSGTRPASFLGQAMCRSGVIVVEISGEWEPPEKLQTVDREAYRRQSW